MKNVLLLSSMVILFMSSCELNKNIPDAEVVLRIGKDLNYNYSNIEMYDSSTHMLYFNDNHKEFNNMSQSTFSFFANGSEVYTGSVWPSFLNSLPNGPYIATPTFYPLFTLRISNQTSDNSDPRNDPELIQSLKEHGVLHSGLSVSISQLVTNGTLLSFSFTVTNQDNSDLLIINPNKTGTNLFHYFTNGLIINNPANDNIFSSNIEVEYPSPWNSWKTDWLTLLKSGESRTYTISYVMGSPINPGKYKAIFVFPGLSEQVSKEQLIQNGGRIWLGDVQISKWFTIP